MSRDAKGRFAKGNSGKPKGTRNKVISNKRIAEYFQNRGFDELINEIDTLEGRDKVTAQIKMLEFVMPRQKAVDMTATVENKEEQKTIEELKKELDLLQEMKKQASWKDE